MELGNKKRLWVASVAAVAVWGYVLFLSPASRQQRWMAESRRLLPRVQSVLGSDARFGSVRVGVSTGCDVIVRGSVASEQALEDLQLVLGSIEFPHGVLCYVTVE
jgi:hypothetical protein